MIRPIYFSDQTTHPYRTIHTAVHTQIITNNTHLSILNNNGDTYNYYACCNICEIFVCKGNFLYKIYDAVPMLNNRYNCCCRNNHDRLMILKHMWKGKMTSIINIFLACNKLHTFVKTAQNFYLYEIIYETYYTINVKL